MNRVIRYASVMVIAVIAAGGIAQQVIWAQEAAAPKQVIDTYEVMELLFEEPYDAINTALEAEPADRAAWKVVYDNSNRLAEVTNLLFFRETEDYEAEAEYKDLAAKSRDAAIAIKEAVRAQDYADAQAKFAAMRESCMACHTKYLGDDAPELD